MLKFIQISPTIPSQCISVNAYKPAKFKDTFSSWSVNQFNFK